MNTCFTSKLLGILLMKRFIYNTCLLAEQIHVTSETMNTNDSFTMSTNPLLESML